MEGSSEFENLSELEEHSEIEENFESEQPSETEEVEDGFIRINKKKKQAKLQSKIFLLETLL